MATSVELLRQGRRDEFWQRHCGFLDLSIEEFMAIQERLLTEQLQLLAASELGRAIGGGKVPLTPGEFRQVTPITIYKDNAPCFREQRQDVLPAMPLGWMRTSGRAGESIAANACQSRPNSIVKLGKALVPLGGIG